MLVVFFDICMIVNNEFIIRGQTVNAECYGDVLRCLRENIQHKQPELRRNGNWALQPVSNKSPFYTSCSEQV